MASRYAAFISYSHASDGRLAPIVQRALQRIGKPWYRRSPVKIFRDATSLSANPGLWTSIEQNLVECDHFLLLASPNAARSPWVAKEIEWWRANREAEKFLIVVTDGQIAWDARSSDFDWERTTCLPRTLEGFAREEPLYVDLRWARRRKPPGLRDPRFRDAMLMLLAPIYGRPKDELDSEDIRQQRRFKLAAVTGALLIAVLALGVVYGAWVAAGNHAEAENSYRESESRRLAAASLDAMAQNGGMDRAITLGVLAWRIAHTPEAEEALQKLQRASGDVARILGQHAEEITHLAFSGDGSVFATGAEDGSVVLWRVPDWVSTGILPPGDGQTISSMSLDRSGSHVLIRGDVKNYREGRIDNKTILWDVKSKSYRVLPEDQSGRKISYDHAALSPDGKLVAVQTETSRVLGWTAGPANRGGKPVRTVVEAEGIGVWDADVQSLQVKDGKTSVIAMRFADDKNLIFLDLASSNGWRVRAGSWNIVTGEWKLGSFATPLEIFDATDLHAVFSGNGSKLLIGPGGLSSSDVASAWRVQDDLTLSRLSGKMPDSAELVFDQDGRRVLGLSSGAFDSVLVWDLAEAKMIKRIIKGAGDGGFNATLSPDGRWLAVVNRSRDAPVVVWDLNRAQMSNPARSLDAVCNLEQTDCINRLCEKISQGIDEPTLRELVGDSLFNEFASSIRKQPCKL